MSQRACFSKGSRPIIFDLFVPEPSAVPSVICKPCKLTMPVPAAYMSSPCHIELFLMEKDAAVKAEQVRQGRFPALH